MDDRSDAIPLEGAIRARDGLHLRFRERGTNIQMVVLGPATASVPLAAVVPLDMDGLDRIRELERLWRALHGRAVPPDTSITLQKRRNLRLMMRAADGRHQGASLREIADALFGEARVGSEPWKTSSLRDKMNRLIRDGSAMISGGYRKLLRSRRPS